LNKLKSVRPDKAWKASQKEILMNQISSSATERQGKNNFFLYVREAFTHEVSFLSQPVATMAIVIFLMVGGGFFSISAASEATPGSFLYTAKLVGEKTQFVFTPSSKEKIKLQILFAERRGEEIENMAVSSEDKIISKVADSLRNEITEVQKRLAEIETKNQETAVELAKDIENRTNTLRQKLVASKQALSSQTSSAETKINEAIRSVDATGLSALNTIVRAGEKDADSEDLTKRVAAKLENTKKKISEVQDDVNKVFSAGLGRSEAGIQLYQMPQDTGKKTAEASEAIIEAEKLLKVNDYKAAMDKINESEDIINKAAENINESKNSAEEEKSTSTPAINTGQEKTEQIPEVRGAIEEAGVNAAGAEEATSTEASE